MKIGILGKGGSGKDTVADILREKGFKCVAFSDGLYEICRNFYGMTVKDRALLQDVGAAMRSVDKDVFVKRALAALKDEEMQCITDVRAVNECMALKDSGFVTVRVLCPLEKRIKRIENRDGIICDDVYIDRLENAPIENYLNDYDPDFVIDNSGSVEDTAKQIEEMLKSIENNL